MTFDLVEHIRRHGFKRLLLAVSGGLDSICLAHYFIEKRETLGIEWLGIAHVHHGLREETADRDAKFVEAFAKSHDVPFFLKRLDGEALKAAEGSLEENARDARYKALVEIALDPSTSLHSAQDDTLQNDESRSRNSVRDDNKKDDSSLVSRLSSFVYLYRPFLDVTRAELLDYARKNKLTWCEDESNADVKFARNKIRHELLPNLERECPGATKQLCRIAELADKTYAKVIAKCEKVFAPCLSNKESLDPIAKCNPRNNGSYRLRLQDDAIKGPSTPLRSAQDETTSFPFNTAQDRETDPGTMSGMTSFISHTPSLVSHLPAKRSLVLNTPYPMVRQKVGEPVEPHQPIHRLATDLIPHTSISLDKKKLNKILREHAKTDLSEMFRLWLSELGFRFPIGFFYGSKEPAHVKIPVRAVYRKRSIVKIRHTIKICEFCTPEDAQKFVSCEMKEKDYNE